MLLGVVVFVKKIYWNSKNDYIRCNSAAMLTGIPVTAIIKFFNIIKCAFPSLKTIFRFMRKKVWPAINQFYKLQQNYLINVIRTQQSIDLCIDNQYDSPRFSAICCVVLAMERNACKIIHFKIVNKSKVNNNSPAAKVQNMQKLFCFFNFVNLNITSAITDNSTNLNRFFAQEHVIKMTNHL